MTAQRSAFTVSGDSFLPLDQEFKVLLEHGRLRKLVLPASMFDDVSSFLAMSGLSAFSFYPDLQGLVMRHEAETRERIVEVKRWYPQFFNRMARGPTRSLQPTRKKRGRLKRNR
jgi:hypothetical protein